MPTSTIISKGRTIPKAVRDALDLHAGDQLRWQITATGIAITKLPGALPMERRHQARPSRRGAGGHQGQENQRTRLTVGEP
jgi:AbrB family looped-hinge helix DNA binding protein